MIRLKDLSKILLITASLFFIVDFIFGEKILKKFGVIYLEEIIRVPNDNYQYSFQSNISSDYAVWGDTYYRLCTDSRGFKFNCLDEEKKNYQLAFIGDSFTEGIGLPFEKTFVGQFKKKTNLDVVNLGVASYSPSIYLQKVKYLINKDIIRFNHLLVGLDLTDLEDDWSRKKTNDFTNISEKKLFNYKIFLAKNFPTTYLILKKIKWYIKIEFTKNLNVSHLDFKKNKASWSYIKNYKNLDEKINNQITHMNDLHVFLRENDIKLSVLIYPHQASIKFDKQDSLYKEIWKDFCINKCFKFIDAYSIFFKELEKNKKKDLMKKYYIKGDPHFNEKGNEMISKILINNLKD